MNTYTLIASLSIALAAATPVLAQEASADAVAISGQAQQADVTSAARLALLSGQQHEAWQIQQHTPVLHSAQRDDVRAAARAALHSGALQQLGAEAPTLGLHQPASLQALQLAGLSR